MSNTNQHSSLDELNETQKMQILQERVQAFTRLLLQERINPGDLSYALSYVSAHMVLYLIKIRGRHSVQLYGASWMALEVSLANVWQMTQPKLG